MPQFPSLDQIKTPQQLPDFEEQVLNYWDDTQAFQRSVSERDAKKPYVFYDGPPFVTGTPHYGSILGSIAKDVVPRYWTMKGYRVERQWGWDCHGLPIENMIEKQLGLKNGKRGIEEYGIANFNNACRDAIAELDANWEIVIRRIGRWVDFKHSYKTMDTSYMESVWWAFKRLHDEKGLIYEDKKVILYCPHCATPLSNFEIAMDNSYIDAKDFGTTYKFALEGHPHTYALAWSTTPWTKIGTMALALHPDLTYVLAQQGENTYLLAESRLGELSGEYQVTETLTGTEATQKFPHYQAHFDWAESQFESMKTHFRKNAYRLVTADFVTADTGTGIVTLAVYGEDDYKVMKEQGIPQYDYVDENGRLDEAVQNPDWVGKSIWKVNDEIDADLEARGLVYKREPHTHSVPTCYRCATRLYYAPLPAWFVNVQKLKPDLVEANESIHWYPEHLKHGRFGNGLKSAPDWNISRSRYWGTPMPVWRGIDQNDPQKKVHTRVIGSVEELKTWAVDPQKVESLTDIHREFIDSIELWVDDAKTVVGSRIPDVFDVWVESGSMPFASRHYPFERKDVFEASYPAQFISEYIAQTRAWFYTLHVLSVGLFGKHSFENVMTTGVITAADGQKMSKSKKNYTDPMELITTQGADALRLYLMASPVTKAENLAFSDTDVAKIRQRVLNMWWNIVSFYRMYQPDDFTPDFEVTTSKRAMDRWLIATLNQATSEITTAFESYNLADASRQVIELVDELSTWYLRLSRDTLRAGDKAAWNTFAQALERLALISAPIVPFISEATWQALHPDQDSVHLQLWPQARNITDEENALLQEMDIARVVVEAGHAQRKEQGIKVRQPLARATVQIEPLSPDVLEIIATELNVKEVLCQPADERNKVTLDTTLTSELVAEGQARELIRSIQQLRREAGTSVDEHVDVIAPNWPESFAILIKEKAKVREFISGPNLEIKRLLN